MNDKPICWQDLVEMECKTNGVNVFYPVAQRLYMADMWQCPRCAYILVLRAPTAFGDITHPSYHAIKADAEVKMWNR